MNQLDLRSISYRIIVYPRNKAPIDITTLCESIHHKERDGSFVAVLDVKLKNIKEREHGWMHSNVAVTTPVRLQATEDQSKWTTIFNGLIYRWQTHAKGHEIELTAYDLLYPLMQSEDHYYFSEGTTGRARIEHIAKDKGVKLAPIKGLIEKLPKKVATGSIARTIEEIVEENNKKTKDKALVRADENGRLYAFIMGKNEVVYEITDWSITDSSHEESIEDLVTIVKVYGNSEKDDKRPPVKATHRRNTSLGEITRIVQSGADDKGEADKEAKEILDEYSKPKKTVRITTPDIPFLRKGDLLRVATGTVGGFKDGKQVPLPFIAKDIQRDVSKRTMTIELEV